MFSRIPIQMGVMRFRVFPPERITEEMVQQAYLSGIDRISWPVRASVEEGDLILQRSVSDSANFYVPWCLWEWFGRLTLSSGSLMEGAEPEPLPLELARGTIVEVRDQLFEWQSLGLSVPETVPAKLAAAVERFSWAVVEQGDPAASARARRGVAPRGPGRRRAAGRRLLRTGAGRPPQQRAGRLGLLGADLGLSPYGQLSAGRFLESFNAANVPILWRNAETSEGSYAWAVTDKQIEWCRQFRPGGAVTDRWCNSTRGAFPIGFTSARMISTACSTSPGQFVRSRRDPLPGKGQGLAVHRPDRPRHAPCRSPTTTR